MVDSLPSFSESHSSTEMEQRRQWMVEMQLRARGIGSSQVLTAMGRVPREAFVLPEWRDCAYDDRALPIKDQQTISQPYTVAFMCEQLQLTGHEKVLDVGTGSGYAAAVLACLAAEVHSIERIPELAHSARDRLARLGYDRVHVHLGDGTLGWPPAAPYDAILVSAAGRRLPVALAVQLTEGGRILIPLGSRLRGQTMCCFTSRGGCLKRQDLGPFAFVPLIGRDGWQSD